MSGTIFYRPEVNGKGDYLFFEKDYMGSRISKLARTHLHYCPLERVDVYPYNPGSGVQTLYGLNLRYCSYTYGSYKGHEGVLINDIFTERDNVRDVTLANPTRFPDGKVFIPG